MVMFGLSINKSIIVCTDHEKIRVQSTVILLLTQSDRNSFCGDWKALTLHSGDIGFSIIGGYWSRRHLHAGCFSGISAMLDLYMGGCLAAPKTFSSTT